MIHQQRNVTADSEVKFDKYPSNAKVIKNKDEQENEKLAEQQRVNQEREGQELQRHLSQLENDLSVMREKVIIEEMKTKLFQKNMELSRGNETNEILQKINQMKTEIAQINTNEVNKIRDCKKSLSDVERKDEPTLSELQHALGNLESKLEARTDDVNEKQRGTDKQHEDVKNEFHTLIRRDSVIADMIKTQRKMEDLNVELNNKVKEIEKLNALSPTPDPLNKKIKVRTEGIKGKRGKTEEQCETLETELYSRDERTSDIGDEMVSMSQRLNKMEERYEELSGKIENIQEMDASLPTLDQMNRKIGVRTKDILDQQRKTEERCEKLTNDFHTQDQRHNKIADKTKKMIEKQRKMEDQFEVLKREFENIEKNSCCIIL